MANITSNYTIQPNDIVWSDFRTAELFLTVDTTSNPVTITLPTINSIPHASFLKIFVVDAGGNAGTNVISVVSGHNTIKTPIISVTGNVITVQGNVTTNLPVGATFTTYGYGVNDSVTQTVLSTNFDGTNTEVTTSGTLTPSTLLNGAYIQYLSVIQADMVNGGAKVEILNSRGALKCEIANTSYNFHTLSGIGYWAVTQFIPQG